MDDRVREFVERMGLLMEAEGMPRIAGRLYGFLLLLEGPYSLDELAEELQVSKASVSTNARLLEHFGILERVCAPAGDRRDFYRIGPGAMERVLRGAQQRWRGVAELLDETAGALPEEMEVSRRRLCESAEFHRLMIGGVDRLFDEWAARLDGRGACGRRAAGTIHDATGPAGAAEARR